MFGTAELSMVRILWPYRSSPLTCGSVSHPEASGTVTSTDRAGSELRSRWFRQVSRSLSVYSARSRACGSLAITCTSPHRSLTNLSASGSR
ncbi:hypothetical protein HD597_005389 [Nonomuraea thailandensis]|uniref:Uncharacterized protein n=1 Tax=Nonomuraea thailandensis TaxID=1188745 RepID=A0A9X2GIW8_9ACTN|nr:hypothetical protein [Nonomuraea thailandensis]